MSIPPIADVSRLLGIRRHIRPALAAGAHVQYTPENNTTIASLLRKYWEMNTAYVINQSDSDVKIEFDYHPNRTLYVPAGSMIPAESVIFQSFTVYNIGTAAITEGELDIEIGNVQPEPHGQRLRGARR